MDGSRWFVLAEESVHLDSESYIVGIVLAFIHREWEFSTKLSTNPLIFFLYLSTGNLSFPQGFPQAVEIVTRILGLSRDQKVNYLGSLGRSCRIIRRKRVFHKVFHRPTVREQDAMQEPVVLSRGSPPPQFSTEFSTRRGEVAVFLSQQEGVGHTGEFFPQSKGLARESNLY